MKRPDRGLESLSVIDTRDDRVELNNLFGKLFPEDRNKFLKWAASTSGNPAIEFQPDDPKVGLTADEATHCLYLLATHFGLKLERIPACLEVFVRRREIERAQELI